MRKSQDEPRKGAPAYMNTYGDMMTLLLCFFVLLFSMSTVDAAKFKAFIDSFSGSTALLDGGDVLIQEVGMLGNGMQEFPTQEAITEEGREELASPLEEVKTGLKFAPFQIKRFFAFLLPVCILHSGARASKSSATSGLEITPVFGPDS